jgi:DNA-binding IclR family transcriptional regulator
VLATLNSRGLVSRNDGTGGYRLGWRLFTLAAEVGEARIVAGAPSILRALVRELGESAHLSVRQGDRVLTLVSESPDATLHAPGRVGGLTPIASTSAGRALVVDLDEDELRSLGLAAQLDSIATARRLGYAIVREEFEPGLVAAAAPVRGPGGRVIAAVNVSAPTFRFGDRLDAAAVRVVAAADALSTTGSS